MKTAIVPAQITTVEDRIAGGISLSQLLLLITPVFIGSAVFVIAPPSFGSSPYKIVLIAAMFIVCSLLAIRVHGQILLLWCVIVLRYNTRPRYYVFDKNDLYLRDTGQPIVKKVPIATDYVLKPAANPVLELSASQMIELQNIATRPEAKLHFGTDKKGVLHAYITEVK
jgi:hypothetical protein